ncbi:leucine-rich repeat domain-containing protein [Ruminococcus albus]|uniref:Leucine rich repeat-containing protein n=1 Tax=Ruminococcus albus TaxID=1264 RepID=A0A1I1EM60_RUMAL|nr:leucine-rich repeat domain-containing protein [Ruminococcus albus]SFB88175.1 Leucine rich repeat-containing protein [Ruminococcus albus]
MKNKKIVAGLLALTFVFGGAALPNTVVNNSVIASASEEAEVLRYGDYEYKLLEDGTAEITSYDFYNSSDTEIEVPAEMNGVAVTSIGERAFSMCVEIKSIVIPDGVKTIGAGAFNMCNSLERIVIPDSVEYIGELAFWECNSLKSITLPKGLKQISDGTFFVCTGLENVVMPDGVESIGSGAFSSCEELKSIVLPKGLKKIGASAFANCQELESITLPEGTEEIGADAFGNCLAIKSISIPASVTKIGDDAFSKVYYTDESEDDSSDYYFKPLKDLVINCYKDSAAHKYALENGNSFEVIDAKDSKTKYPELIKEGYSSKYRQFRLNWTVVGGAQQYGIAVKLAGKWKVQAYTDAAATTYTSPKLTSDQSYQVVICAKVNGKWDTSALNNRAFTLTVR